MPRYFFNVFPDGVEHDAEGSEFPNIYIAQSQAIRMTGEIMTDLGRKVWSGGQWRLEVSDFDGQTLFIVRFSAEEVLPA